MESSSWWPWLCPEKLITGSWWVERTGCSGGSVRGQGWVGGLGCEEGVSHQWGASKSLSGLLDDMKSNREKDRDTETETDSERPGRRETVSVSLSVSWALLA